MSYRITDLSLGPAAEDLAPFTPADMEHLIGRFARGPESWQFIAVRARNGERGADRIFFKTINDNVYLVSRIYEGPVRRNINWDELRERYGAENYFEGDLANLTCSVIAARSSGPQVQAFLDICAVHMAAEWADQK